MKIKDKYELILDEGTPHSYNFHIKKPYSFKYEVYLFVPKENYAQDWECSKCDVLSEIRFIVTQIIENNTEADPEVYLCYSCAKPYNLTYNHTEEDIAKGITLLKLQGLFKDAKD